MPPEDFSPAVPVTSLSPPCFSDPDVAAQPLSAITRNTVPYASTRFDWFMGVPPHSIARYPEMSRNLHSRGKQGTQRRSIAQDRVVGGRGCVPDDSFAQAAGREVGH